MLVTKHYPLLFATVIGLILAGCSGDFNDRTAEKEAAVVEKSKPYVELGDIDSIGKRGELRVLIHSNDDDFLPRNGRPQEIDQAMLQRFADEQGLAMTTVAIENFDELIPRLLDGKGDIIAANLTVTDKRANRVGFSLPLDLVTEHLVSSKQYPLTALSQLSDRVIAVQQEKTFWDTAEKLKVDFPGLKIKMLPGEMSNDEIFDYISESDQYLTLADSNVISTLKTYRDDLIVSGPLAQKKPTAWAVRPNNTELLAQLNQFIQIEKLIRPKKENRTNDWQEIKKRKHLRVALRNNSASYFLWRGKLLGFDYELIKAFAEKNELLIDVIVPPSHEKLIDYVRSGKADIAAGFLSITDGRKQNNVVFSNPYHYASELIVEKKEQGKNMAIDDLSGRTIHVRRSSNYWKTIRQLQKQVAVNLVATPENEETEEAIAKVASGEYDLTVADNHILDIELTWRKDVHSAMVLGAPLHQGWAVRESNPALLKALNQFITKEYRGLFYNMTYKKYFTAPKGVAKLKKGQLAFSDRGKLSPYDDIVKKFATKYNFDWRLLVAQMYQESHFNPKAESWAGAIGLFQVMPKTAKELGYKNLQNPKIGIEAGVKYLHWSRQRFPDTLTVTDRLWFTLAAYNAGAGHVHDARRLAKQQGFNPNLWFDNVEKAMLLLSQRKYASKARHGYVRGQEPVSYVRAIRDRFNAYVQLTEKRVAELNSSPTAVNAERDGLDPIRVSIALN